MKKTDIKPGVEYVYVTHPRRVPSEEQFQPEKVKVVAVFKERPRETLSENHYVRRDELKSTVQVEGDRYVKPGQILRLWSEHEVAVAEKKKRDADHAEYRRQAEATRRAQGERILALNAALGISGQQSLARVSDYGISITSSPDRLIALLERLASAEGVEVTA